MKEVIFTLTGTNYRCKVVRDIIYFAARVDKSNIVSQKMIEKLNSIKRMQIQNYYCYEIHQDI